MSMKVYGHPWSLNTRKTLMTLAEKGHDAELVVVALPLGEQKLPAHVARHPWGRVPVLDDDGFVVYETRAINRYLDARLDGPRLVPADPRGVARAEMWMNVADAYFTGPAAALVVETLFRAYLGGPQDAALIASARAQIQQPLAVFDRWLAESAYAAGDAFSLADIHWMPYLEYLRELDEGGPGVSLPNVSRWWASVSARPTWRQVARTGPQPYQPDVRAGLLEKLRVARGAQA